MSHFCRLDTALHPVDKSQECRYFLFEDDNEKISKYCQVSVLNQTRDPHISIDKTVWAITTQSLGKMYIFCLTYSYSLSLQYPFDIIFLPNSHEPSSYSFFLCSSDKLTWKEDSRNFSITFINLKEK